MGKPSVTGIELAAFVQTTPLTALNIQSPGAQLLGTFNIVVSGVFVGTVSIQASYDGGTTIVPLIAKRTGQAITFTAPGALQEDEVEAGVLYFAQMTAYTSGTANVRFSAGADSGDSRRLT